MNSETETKEEIWNDWQLRKPFACVTDREELNANVNFYIEECRDLELMMDYFKDLTNHEDQAVREAARKCMEVYATPRWRSKTMRQLLSDLSWALRNYLDKMIMIETEKKEIPF